MLTLKDDIYMLKNEIERIKLELEEIDPKLPDNRFKYANKKSELNNLYRRLDLLTNEQDEQMKTIDLFIPNKQNNFITGKRLVKKNCRLIMFKIK